MGFLSATPATGNVCHRKFGQTFADFVVTVDRLVRTHSADEALLCRMLTRQIRPLLSDPSWVPVDLTEANSDKYRRECLYEAANGSFSIGVFTWFPTHTSHIHDHEAWSVIGNLTGMLRSENFLAITPDHVAKHAADHFVPPGAVLWSTRATGDIHRVSVASQEKSTSIHVYGCRFDAVNRNYYTE